MPELIQKKIDDAQFELLCCDIMEHYYGKKVETSPLPNIAPSFRLYGRKGQNQHGIDIISRKPVFRNGFCVVQCKNYKEKTKNEFPAQIRKDVNSIQNSGIHVSCIYVMTTLPRDTNLQDFEREMQASLPDKEFCIFFWEDLSNMIVRDNVLLSAWNKGDFYTDNSRNTPIKCPRCREQMILKEVGQEVFYQCDHCKQLQKINVFVSLSSPINKEQKRFRDELNKLLKSHGMDALTLGYNIYDMEYPLRGVQKCMEQCYGLITLGFRRTKITTGEKYKKYDENSSGNTRLNVKSEDIKDAWLTSPFCHMESTMAYQYNLPILVFREKDVVDDGIFEKGNTALYLPEIDLDNYYDNEAMQREFKQLMILWIEKVKALWNERFMD